MKILLPLMGLLLASCSSVDFEYPKTESTYIPDTSDTYLAGEVADAIANRPADTSGFLGLVDGIDAAAARFRLAATAERSIDVQYYLIKRDAVGQAFMYALLQAADRGVRVRLLLDDMFTKGYDKGLMALDSHPNFEIRVFNPFNRGMLGRNLGAAVNFRRVNRRMHNKSFTVDNQVTIIGGRNIADEYFGGREDSAFDDIDAIGLGPIVQDVSNMFDTYWRHRTAVPVAAFIKPLREPEVVLAQMRVDLAAHNAELKETRYAKAVINRLYAQIETDNSVFHWAPYALIYDTPDKGIKNKADPAELITAKFRTSLATAESELYILSPYFVPQKTFRDVLIDFQERGVNVHVVTNSLAANNQKMVHGGYAPARKPLLKAGVSLYEVRPDALVPGTEYVDSDSSRATLHTKSYILDRREVFIGSFNFDPRSANINTEMGVLVQDEPLAADYVAALEKALSKGAWKLSLNERNKLEWTGLDKGEQVVYYKEPMTNWWQRFKAGFYRMLPIRGQL